MGGRVFYATVNGLTPICFNKRIPEPKKRLVGKAWDDRETEVWQDRIERNDAGQVIVPRRALRKTFIEATRFSEMKAPGRMKSWRPLIENCMMIEDDMVLEYDEKKLRGWSNYVTRGRGQVLLIRPVIDTPWSGGFRIASFDDAITASVVDGLAEVAGRVCGYMEARKFAGYGRAQITITEVKEGVKAA